MSVRGRNSLKADILPNEIDVRFRSKADKPPGAKSTFVRFGLDADKRGRGWIVRFVLKAV